MSCSVDADKIHALVIGVLPPDEARTLRAHATSCPRCAPVLRSAGAAIDALGAQPIATPEPVQRGREIARALAAQPVRRPLWRLVAPALVGVALTAALVVVLMRTTGSPVRVVAGPLAHTIVVGTPELVTDDVTLELRDGSRIEAKRGSHFTLQHASRWQVTQGELHFAMRKQKEPFVVTTAEVVVTVVGTRFTVEREGNVTHVAVQEGRVAVEAAGIRTMLGAGDVWPVPSPPQPTPPLLSEPSPTPPTESPIRAKRFDAGSIRARIAAGKVAEARTLIAVNEKTFADSLNVVAELKVLTAEADLAERKYRPALDKYLAVVRDYPTTPQAEQALFAAAQLAFDEPAAGYQPERLLKDYLATYPHGRFHNEAERLLRATAK